MRNCICLLLFLFLGEVYAQNNRAALMPMPNSIEDIGGKAFIVTSFKSRIYINDKSLDFAAKTLQNIFKEQMLVDVLQDTSEKSEISLLIDPVLKEKEHYIIQVDKKGVVVRGATSAAVFYGVMTLEKILIGDVYATSQKQISPVRIDDQPRFSYRALMIDPARNFLPVDDIKFYIDQMARYKYNVLQLHLTDDQGWRIDIKKYPSLASKEHYTQEQLAELVRYAAERHIEIVPEIDIPGHTVAMLAVFPELGCSHTDTIVKKVGETNDLMLCAANDKVYDVFRDVISEVAALFPSKRIHLGGDEAVVEKNWAKCIHCNALMKKLGYEKASRLMIPFFEKMLGFVRENGKEPILWCELNNAYMPANDYLFPYDKDVTLVTWRMGLTPKCLELTRQHGNPIIMAPGEFAYLDYPQLKGDLPEFNNWGMPVTTLEKCYQFDPGYGTPLGEQTHILGVMGTLWGEAIKDINRVCYMTFPRGFAMAEAGWTQMEHRSWDSFKERMYPNLMLLMKQGVSVRVPFEIVDRAKGQRQ